MEVPGPSPAAVRSTFPPILRAYHPELEGEDGKAAGPSSRCKATHGIRVLLEGRREYKSDEKHSRQRGYGGRERQGGQGNAEGIGAGQRVLASAQKIISERDLELRRKKMKRAEATLRSWDLLQQEERNKRYSVLKQRVQLQREVITKASNLSDELRGREKEKRIKEIQSRKEARKETVTALRSHMRRVEEHKRKIAAKLLVVQASAHVEKDGLSSPLLRDTILKEDNTSFSPGLQGQFSECAEESGCSSVGSNDEYLAGKNRVTRHALLQELGVDPLNEEVLGIETMWGRRKADVARRLRPVAKYSQQLKQVVSPSVRQCLDIYEQPTARDRYTGKAVPLTDVLTSVTQSKSEDLFTSRRRIMARSAKRNQQKAQIMLSRKDQSVMLPRQDPGLYVGDYDDPQLTSRPKPNLGAMSKVQRKHLEDISPKLKKKLPQLLTRSGDLVATSLEEVGDKVYYSRSRSRGKHNHRDISTFLTDLPHNEEDHIPVGMECRTLQSSWQPLSCSALTEYRGVAAVPVSRHTFQKNQRLWRPSEATAY